MNLRRYTLFLIVALLTFIIGVTAAVVIGHVNPFPRARAYRRCGRVSALPAPNRRSFVYTVYRSDGTVLKSYEVDKTDWTDKLGETSDATAPQPTIVVTESTNSNR